MCAQVQARVRDNADWLFKCVGAANAALSDTALRRQLDADLAAQEGRGYYSAYSSPSSSHYYSREADLFSRSCPFLISLLNSLFWRETLCSVFSCICCAI
jgi:hypothetical protein